MSIFEEHRDRYHEEILMQKLAGSIIEHRQIQALRFQRYAEKKWNNKFQRLSRWIRKIFLGQHFPSNMEFLSRINNITRLIERGYYDDIAPVDVLWAALEGREEM